VGYAPLLCALAVARASDNIKGMKLLTLIVLLLAASRAHDYEWGTLIYRSDKLILDWRDHTTIFLYIKGKPKYPVKYDLT